MNEYKNNKIKWVAVFTAIILLFIGVASALYLVLKPAENEPADVEGSEVESEVDDPIVMSFQEEGITLLSANLMTASESDVITKTLSATVNPSTADQTVSWSMAFANPNSTWAKGKNIEDYVTYTVSDSSTYLYISNSQPFGEQIVITCTCVANNSLSATCTLDYEKRITNVSFGIKEATAGTVSAINFSDNALTYTFSATPTYGVGTITPTGTTTCTYKFTDAFRKAIDYSYTFNGVVDALTGKVVSTSYDISDSLVMKAWGSYNVVRGAYNSNLGWLVYDHSALSSAYNTGSTYTYLESSVYTSAIAAQKAALQSYSGNVLEISYNFSSSNGNTYTTTKYVGMGTCNFPSLDASSVSLSKSAIVL